MMKISILWIAFEEELIEGEKPNIIPYTYHISDMVESDSTPFPIVSYDGFAIN